MFVLLALSAFSVIWHFTLIITGFLYQSTRLFGPLSTLTWIFSSTLGLCHTLPFLYICLCLKSSRDPRLFSHYGLFISSVSCPGLAPPAPLFYGVSLYINLLPNCYTFWFQFTKIIFFSKILQIIWWTQIYVHVTIKDQKSRCSRRVRKSLFIIQICQSSNHLIDSNLVNQSSNLVRSPLNLSLFSCTMTSKMNWLMSVIFSTFKILWFLW